MSFSLLPGESKPVTELVDDLTPQLGGDLDANGSDITGIGHIGFLATQDASAGANDLDDYEEGTWTVGISFGGGVVSITYGDQSGLYTKVGNEVHVEGIMTLTSNGSSTGDALITGLPFTTNGTAQAAVTLQFHRVSFNGTPQGRLDLSGTTIRLNEAPAAGGSSTSIEETNVEDTATIYVQASYRVA